MTTGNQDKLAAILAATPPRKQTQAGAAPVIEPVEPDLSPDADADPDADDFDRQQRLARRPAGKKPPKKPTPGRLRNQALHYIGKFETSAANLKQVLQRKAKRALYHHDDIEDEAVNDWIDDIIRDFSDKGWISDDRYAEVRSRSLSRQGKSARGIAQNLASKGVGRDVIEDTINDLNEEESDLVRACRLTRKRRLWQYRAEEKRADRLDKDKAVLARAGFSFEVIDRIFRCQTIEDLQALEEESLIR